MVVRLADLPISGVAVGLAPALQASNVDLSEAMKADGGHSDLVKQNRLRSTMVVAQVALALVVLVGAGLMLRTIDELQEQYSGLQPNRVLTLRTDLPLNKYDEPQKRVNFYDDVLRARRSLPNVCLPPIPRACRSNGKAARRAFIPRASRLSSALSTTRIIGK